jgi:hypothetical protein
MSAELKINGMGIETIKSESSPKIFRVGSNKKWFCMKNIFVIAICLAAVSMFNACKDGDNKGKENNTEQNSNNGNNGNNGNGNNQTSDLTTVKGFLAAFGLTENDLQCAHQTRLDKTTYSLETKQIKEVGVYVSQKLTNEEVKAWLDKVIGKLCSLSAEGKIDNLLTDGDLTTDYIMSQTMYMGSGSYTYNGKKVSVLIDVMPGYLDNADPDDAMAACTLKLEFRN